MNALEVIACKRDALEHTPEEIQLLLAGYVRGEIPDYQMAAWLMAVCIRGMTPAETLALTQAMVARRRICGGVRPTWPTTRNSAARPGRRLAFHMTRPDLRSAGRLAVWSLKPGGSVWMMSSRCALDDPMLRTFTV